MRQPISYELAEDFILRPGDIEDLQNSEVIEGDAFTPSLSLPLKVEGTELRGILHDIRLPHHREQKPQAIIDASPTATGKALYRY